MAALTSDQIDVAFKDGRCGRNAYYLLKNVSANDTFDVGGEFKVVDRAGMVSITDSHIAAVSFSGTVGTIPTGPANDGVAVVVVGVAK